MYDAISFDFQPKDENFLLQEKRFRNLEKTLRLFVKNIEVVMIQIHSEVKILFDVGEELVQYYGDQSSKAPEVEGIRSAQRNIADSIWHGFVSIGTVQSRSEVPCP